MKKCAPSLGDSPYNLNSVRTHNLPLPNEMRIACLDLADFDLSRYLAAIGLFIQRHKVIFALLGIGAGAASYFLIERQPVLALWLTSMLAVSWLLIVLDSLWTRLLTKPSLQIASTAGLQLFVQSLQQEALFFCIPFLLLATVWDSGQVVYTGLVIFAALVAVIDPLYHFTIARSRGAWLALHSFAIFACMQLCLPLLFQVPAGDSLLIALLVTVVAATPSYWAISQKQALRKWLTWLLIAPCFALLIWFGRSGIPVPAIQVKATEFSVAFDIEAKMPKATATEFRREQMAGGLYAYTPIIAPAKLDQNIRHDWYWQGRLIDSIPMRVTGGRKDGFRAWTVKRNFPSKPLGEWVVETRTGTNQLLARASFTVRP